jgi:hypothetical protein
MEGAISQAARGVMNVNIRRACPAPPMLFSSLLRIEADKMFASFIGHL